MSLWRSPIGRELDTTPLVDIPAPRIVACLNVWNDLPALEHTVPSWRTSVDHIIAVDGSYAPAEPTLSTDGTREYLLGLGATIIDAAGLSQCEKRTKYFEAAAPGDTLFIIDADEAVTDAQTLRQLPTLDVGWVRIASPLYAYHYGQPRVIRWMPDLAYRGRHHWIYQGEQLLCTHQYAGPGYAQRTVALTIEHLRQFGRPTARRDAKRTHAVTQRAAELPQIAMPTSATSDTTLTRRESLRILQIAYRDDGLAPSRLHTSINRTTPHTSVFGRVLPGPFGATTQYDIKQGFDARMNAVGRTADVLHHHVKMHVLRPRPHAALHQVFHHHGSMLRNHAVPFAAQAVEHNALILVSNLELLSWADNAHFLPNAVPVARYAALRAVHQRPFDGMQPFRVAHSPSQPLRKNTDAFLAACERLQAKGVPIEPVMIQNQTHSDALQIKATCHAAFDAFWLGMQCSGLEAAAMGLPVVAGDETVAGRFREMFGAVPYTFANTTDELEEQLLRLVTDADFRAQETARVYAYTVAHHDEAAVALRYLDLLDEKFGWRSAAR
jgi:hypothetical protein